MFKLIQKPTFVGEAEIPAAGGEIAVLKFVFKYRTKPEAEAWLKDMAKAELSDRDGMLTMVEGWLECDTPFSPEAIDTLLLQYYDVIRPTMDAYLAGLQGAKRKN